MSRAARLEPLILLVLPLVWSCFLFSPAYAPDPDTYFHVGVGRRIAEEGWLGSFRWLPYTSLHEPYPDMFLVPHLVLAVLAGVLGPSHAVPAGVLVMACGLAASLYLVLQRHGVRHAALWVTLGLLATPATTMYALSIKGGTGFFIILIWFLDALWSERPRRVAVLAAVSVYVYVGALFLVPVAIAHVAVLRAWSGRWRWALLAAPIAGLLAGMIVNPYWPAQWTNVAGELETIYDRDPRLVAGVWHGAEWIPLVGKSIVTMAGASLAAWGVVLFRRFGRAEALPPVAASAAVMALGLIGASLWFGSKFLYLGALISVLAVPMVVRASTWPRRAPLVAMIVAALVAARTVDGTADDMFGPGHVHTADYRAMGAWLDERTRPGEVVLAPWDDFPGLFLFSERPAYVAGWSVRFLLEHDRKRFDGYYLLYEGRVSDPEKLLPALFDGARWLVVRRQPRNPGESALLSGLTANQNFEEVAGPATAWRVFRVR